MKNFGTISIQHFAILIALILSVCVPETLAARDLKVILKSPSPTKVIDNLGDGEREQAIQEIRAAISGRPDGDEFVDLLALACSIRPWTTGTENQDIEFQKELAAIMVAEASPHTDVFRYADCATFNRQGTYRAFAIAPLFNLRQEWCSRAKFSQANGPVALDTKYIARMNEVINAIEAFNSASDALISQQETERGKALNQVGFSYYPLRNQLRLSMLEAAQAVHFAQAGDMGQAQKQFLETAQRLRDYRSSFIDTPRRNNWRFVVDLDYYIALYDFLGGKGNQSAFSDLINAGSVTESASELPPNTIPNDIDETYYDFVFMERLLPGLQFGQPECRSWRARFYDVVALAKFTQDCAVTSIDDYDGLRSFDICMANFEATDWTIQILSAEIVNNDRKVAQTGATIEAMRFVNNLREFVEDKSRQATMPSCRTGRNNIAGVPFSFLDHFPEQPFRYDVENGFVVVFMADTFCTTEIEWFRQNLKEIVGPLGIAPLFRRPRLR